MGPEWNLPPSAVLDLPLRELAMHVLRDWDSTNEWNLHNWMSAALLTYPKKTDVLRALSEALNWLIGHGLLARGDPEKSSNEAAFITRLGRRVLDTGEVPRGDW